MEYKTVFAHSFLKLRSGDTWIERSFFVRWFGDG
ncbi:hypothetical protein KIPB_014083, partial [Kipferlia bialata]|eukprot:g14083.t1